VDFTLPEHLPGLLAEMDAFIEAEIKPLERSHMQYFDQRREHARTDWDNDGIPSREWEDLLAEMRRRADQAGWLRYGLPASLGGRDGTNVDMAVIRSGISRR
jgi:alkylation response protein AidB-like acyl-CoA dehydrogenase